MSGTPIPRTKFLLFKPPVSPLYEEKFGGGRNMFTVSMYAERMMSKKIQVGCVIDCTALDLTTFESLPSASNKARKAGTVRYFHDTLEWDDFGIEYHHLLPPSSVSSSASSSAHSPVPPLAIMEKFFSICSSHWSSRPGAHIALFDSRGGYGIAAYLAARHMCDKMRAPVHVALASIKEAATPCGLADVDLIKDLQLRYNGRREWKIANVPKWWWPHDDDDGSGDDGEDDREGSTRKEDGPKDELVIVVPPFDPMEGSVPTAGREQKRRKVDQSFSEMKVAGLDLVHSGSPKYERAVTVLKQLTSHSCDQLPSSEGVLMDSSDSLASLLPDSRYKVTWRSKGRRGLLLILSEGVYFLENDKDGHIAVSIVKGGMHFPVPTDLAKVQHRTLLDGVLAIDKEGDNRVPRYYASDILCHMGGILISKPFSHRIKYLVDGVISPRKKDSCHNYGQEGIKIRAKELFPLGKVEFVLKEVTRGIAHEAEGIVFVPLEGGYIKKGQEGKGEVAWTKRGSSSEEDLIQHILSLTP